MTDRFEEENNNSLVLKTEINGTEFLFTGDIEAEDEKYLMNSDIECDIIKIPHHGSKTSSTEAFIEAVNADIAVIEAAEDNIYGFPHEEVVERLNNNGCDIYVTGKDGAVTVYCRDNKYEISTYNEMR